MKKFIMSILVCVGVFLTNIASAAYPELLNGDPNYIICGAHMGYAGYISRSSVQVVERTDDGVTLKMEVVWIENADRGNVNVSKRTTNYYFYKNNPKEMYSYSNSDKKWYYKKPVGSYADTGHYFNGEMAYCIAFDKPYYGGQQWYNSDTRTYEEPACEYIYKIYRMYR